MIRLKMYLSSSSKTIPIISLNNIAEFVWRDMTTHVLGIGIGAKTNKMSDILHIIVVIVTVFCN